MNTESIEFAINAIVDEGLSTNDLAFDIDDSDIEVESFNFSYGSIEDIELSGTDNLTIRYIEGDNPSDYVIYNKRDLRRTLSDRLTDLVQYDAQPDRGIELAQLGKIIDDCIGDAVMLIADNNKLTTMTKSEVSSAIVSQFSYWLNHRNDAADNVEDAA